MQAQLRGWDAVPKCHQKSQVINTHALPPAVHWGTASKEALPAALNKLQLSLFMSFPSFSLRQCSRAFLMVSRSLRQTGALNEIQETLGELCVGVWDGMPAHTPRDAVIEAAKEAT